MPLLLFLDATHREDCGSELFRLGSSPQDYVLLTGERDKNAPFSTYLKTKEPRDMPVEQFLSMLRFDSREKLKDLPLELGK